MDDDSFAPQIETVPKQVRQGVAQRDEDIGILDALGVQRTHLVGHDWGAALAWRLAGSYLERFDHVVVLSVGAALMADSWELFRERRGPLDDARPARRAQSAADRS